MEASFGQDLYDVRLHDGPMANQLADWHNAHAVTVGRHVHFATDSYAPGTPAGDAILAHELAHAVQYGNARQQMHASEGALENEATAASAQVAGGRNASVQNAASGTPLALTRGQKAGVGAGIGAGVGLALGGIGLAIAAAVGVGLGGGAIAGVLLGGAALGGILGSIIGGTMKEEEATPAPLTYDQMQVERARQRLEVLYEYLDIHHAAMARVTRRQSERGELARRRAAMDADMIFGEFREPEEQRRIGRLNRRPLHVEVTEDAVRFNVRFHVRFEGKTRTQAERDFQRLEQNMRTGIEQIWNQEANAIPIEGRRFELVPQFTLVDAAAPRDLDYWLITVRPADNAPATFDGQALSDQPLPSGAPTSVTNPDVGGGVMSIPPSHIGKPDVLGHELLHLFGLIDRYALLEEVLPSGQRRVSTEPARSTGGRPDPLGSESGPILAEDLNFLFEEFDVYDAVNSREMREAQMQTEGISYHHILGEIHRLEEIVETGRDPRSLLPIRQDFTDRMIRSAEDL